MSDSLRSKLEAATCAGCRAGEPVEYIAGYKAHRKMNIICHSQAETLLPIIEPEINQARREALEQAAEHRPNYNYNGDITDCIACDWRSTPYPKNNRDVNEWEEHVAKLSSVQQEAPKPYDWCQFCKALWERNPASMMHRHPEGDTFSYKCEYPAINGVLVEPVAAPTDISGEKKQLITAMGLLQYALHRSGCDYLRGEREEFCDCGLGRLKIALAASQC